MIKRRSKASTPKSKKMMRVERRVERERDEKEDSWKRDGDSKEESRRRGRWEYMKKNCFTALLIYKPLSLVPYVCSSFVAASLLSLPHSYLLVLSSLFFSLRLFPFVPSLLYHIFSTLYSLLYLLWLDISSPTWPLSSPPSWTPLSMASAASQAITTTHRSHTYTHTPSIAHTHTCIHTYTITYTITYITRTLSDTPSHTPHHTTPHYTRNAQTPHTQTQHHTHTHHHIHGLAPLLMLKLLS